MTNGRSQPAGSSSSPGKSEQETRGPAQPSVTLPKGGGAIHAMGEKFAANPVTGTASLTVPIPVSPGRSGFSPQLALSYDSGSGNGPFGFGWSLSLPSITRRTDKGLPQYRDGEESDIFILSGSEDLVPILAETGNKSLSTKRTVKNVEYSVQAYRPRIEGLFARIERWTGTQTGEIHWRSITRDNITTLYGKDNNSRIFDPDDSNPNNETRVFTWLICETYDDKGNAIVYKYAEENSEGIDPAQTNERNRTESARSANRYLKRIQYGNLVSRLTQPDPGVSGWLFEVVFDYGEHDSENPAPDDAVTWLCRHDPFSTYRPGFELRTYRLCQRVLMFHHFAEETAVGANCLVRSIDFVYQDSRGNPEDRMKGNPIASFIASITQSGYKRLSAGGYLKKSLPPLEFEYSKASVNEEIRDIDSESVQNLPYGLDGSSYQWVDLDGEGVSGVLTRQGEGWFYKRNLSPISKGLNNGHDIVARFAPVEVVAQQPSLGDYHGRQQFIDLAGDGQLDLVQFHQPLPGFYERTQDAGWSHFAPFESLPTVDWDDPNLKFVDLTGDGHADVIISEDNVFTWYPSLAEAGFGAAERVYQSLDEERGPRLVFSDGTQSIYLADLSGDGLTDLVRVRNGEVCYWPNLGYGRFGARVTMDNSPWFDRSDLFDQRRIRLADIDGSGATDIIYIGSDGVHLYFNQSGNSWTEVHTLSNFPRIDNLSSLTAVDLLGNGTACLVWSSPLPEHSRQPMRYIDLMGGQKPHLMLGMKNNLGAETRTTYATSTRFYLEDKAAGRPWITRLPFPVHVVERVETIDRISRNRFVSSYAYHHGYFDGIEREFRGFGMVEQLDTEEFTTLSTTDTLPDAVNIESASHVPPALTKTWFHTGALLEEPVISRQFEREYYREGDPSLGEAGLSPEQLEAMLLEDTSLPNTVLRQGGARIPWTLSAEETREACRALKGSILRQEVYARDRTEEADRPYTASERNYTVELLQPLEENKHAVFFVHPREQIDFHYERKLFDVGLSKLADPRVTHAMTLEVDGFGNVLKSVAIGYGRRRDDPNALFTDEDKQKQRLTLVTLTENEYTNPVLKDDDYRVPVLCEARTYELHNLPPAAASQTLATNLFHFDEIRTKIEPLSDGLHEVPYEQFDASGTTNPRRRLIERVRTIYRHDELTGALPFKALGSRALPFESYKLAFTPGLLTSIYQRERQNLSPENLLPDPVNSLLEEGAYVDLDGDGHWWIPSGQVFFNPGVTSPDLELAFAKEHFFLPHRFQDPFSNSAFVSYDKSASGIEYSLLISSTKDAVGNEVQAKNDYRVLQPRALTDPNGNRSEVAFDALGMVVGTAVMGKETETLGDSLEGFEPDLTPAQIDGFYDVADPHLLAPSLLKDASTRIVYDLDRFRRTRQAQPGDPTQWLPVYAATLARETHVSDPLPPQGIKIQISFSCSDGFGREIQKKIQAEPGALDLDNPASPVINPRWVVSGWTIFNNKGKPVRQYEPFFSATHQFEFARTVGVSPILFYDPVERVVATLHPNHTYEKVVFDPWRQETWDVNDTVLQADPKNDPDVGEYFERLPVADYLPTWHDLRKGKALGPHEQSAALKTAVHDATPTVAYFDTLGRMFLTIAHNKFKRSDSPAADPPVEEFHATRVVFDIEGNQREVIDALDRVVMRYDYDMLSNRSHQASMEAGERWMLNDVTGKAIRAWNSRGFIRRMTYDNLRRPTAVFVTESGVERLAERTAYGESLGDAGNHRTRVHQVFDGAGVVTSEAYDFKGNLLRGRRELLPNYRQAVDWLQNPLPNDGTFTSSTTYDALNRPLTVTTPDKSIYSPAFNEANLLDSVKVNLRGAAATPFVINIDYNAKGQRELIEYGNGARTTYDYDPLTFRLTKLTTARPALPDDTASQIFKSETLVQDLRYTYDPAGNITHIEDAALKTIVHAQQQVEPVCEYIYDAVYRLIEASGREHIGQTALDFNPPDGNRRDFPFFGLRAHPNDAQAMRNYIERYQYDEVGNFEVMSHVANGGSWNREYLYNEDSLLEPATHNSNRLTLTKVGSFTETYSYKDADGKDVHGGMTAINSMKMVWDFKDQLQQVDLGGGGTGFYVYDASGLRVRKVIETQNGTRKQERIYLGGFEVYREYENSGSAVKLERETLHVMDDKQRIALVETKTKDTSQPPTSNPQPLIRYQFGNHLGSASLELDNQAQIISYEEYFPYGSASYQAVRNQTETPKRYRYTGKERDEESGLYYYGARFYAAWLGRWTSADPIGILDDVNLYSYVRSSPIKLLDPKGTATVSAGHIVFTDEDIAAHPEQHVITAQRPASAPLTDVKEAAAGGSSSTLEILQSETAQAVGGIVAGGIEANVPGMSVAHEIVNATVHPEAPSRTFEVFRGISLGLYGIAQVIVGGEGLVVGSAGVAAGAVAAPVTGGGSLVVSAGGVALDVASAALAAQGVSNVAAGAHAILNAMSMSGGGSGSGSPPSNSSRGSAGTQPAKSESPGRPKFEPNPAHKPGARGFGRHKTVEPGDSEAVYDKAVRGSDGIYYGKGGNGEIYRFTPNKNGGAHFTGMTGPGSPRGIRLEEIPIAVRRLFGIVR